MAVRVDPPPHESRFPIPLVGAAAILVLLILLTPILLTGGGGAGAVLAQADLVVDHPPRSLTTSFYVHSVGEVRYAKIDIGLNEDYVKDTPASLVQWTSWTNVTDQILSYVTTSTTNSAVNVSVYYLPTSGSGVWYYGILTAIYDPVQQVLTLTSLAGGLATPSGPVSTVNTHTFPYTMALAYQSGGGPPP